MATIIVVKRRLHFLTDESLSWKAVGVLAYLVNKAPRRRNVDLMQELVRGDVSYGASKGAIYSILQELEEKRYHIKIRSQKKRRPVYAYIFTTKPYKPLTESSIEALRQVVFTSHSSGTPGTTVTVPGDTEAINTILFNKIKSNLNHFFSLREKKSDRVASATSLSVVGKKRVDSLMNYWCSNIIDHSRHKSSARYNKALEVLTKKYIALGNNRYAFHQIKEAIATYKRLLDDRGTCFFRWRSKAPWKVGLDEFFRFSLFTLDNVIAFPEPAAKKMIARLDGVKGWYEECSKGFDYCLKKYMGLKKSKHVEAAELFKDFFDDSSSDAERIANIAADRFMQFWEEIQGKLKTADSLDSKYPLRFLKKYVFKMVEEKYWKKNKAFKPYFMLTPGFFTREVRDYLREVGVWRSPAAVQHIY